MKKLLSGMALLGMLGSAPVLAAGSDELWEMTTKMDMPGMSMAMPATKQTFCQPKDGAYKPDKEAKQDKNCEVTDMQVSGNTTKWKMRCTGKDAMEGSGEMTRTADTMNGTFKMTSKHGQMTSVMSGRRIGACDAAAERKKMEDKVNTVIGDMCTQQTDMAVKSGGYEPKVPEMFAGKGQCTASKPALCEKAQAYAGGYEGYAAYAKSKGWVPAECGINLEARRAALCQKAAAEKKYDFLGNNCPAEICKVAMSDRKYGMVAKYCPAESRSLNDKYCGVWGRDYTSDHDNEYAPICAKYSKNKSRYKSSDDSGDEESASTAGNKSGSTGKPKESTAAKKEEKPAAGDNPAAAVLDGAKKLKGLFNF